MKEEDLKVLIEKYYSGESTEDEEFTLRNYFLNNEPPKGMEAEANIFRSYSTYHELPVPAVDFEDRIIAEVDLSNKVFELKQIRRFFPYISAAAGILILIATYFFFVNRSGSEDTYTDPQIAYNETMKILLNVSSKLNQGTQALEPVSKFKTASVKSFQIIDKSTQIVEENLMNLIHLQNAIDLETKEPVKK
jgi:hypothetical protein